MFLNNTEKTKNPITFSYANLYSAALVPPAGHCKTSHTKHERRRKLN